MSRARLPLRATAPLLGLALLAGALGIRAVASEAAEEAAPAALRVTVRPVHLEPGYAVTHFATGRVRARRASDLGFERTGRVAEVAVEEGARVAEGDVLARLTTAHLALRRDELGARVAAARARLELARRTAARSERLSASDHLSPQAFDDARFGEQALASELAAAQAALAAVDEELERSILRAPFAGTVERRWLDEGVVIAPGQALLRVLEDGALEVRIGLPGQAADGLAPGSVREIEVGDARLAGRLAAVLPSVDPETRTVDALFALVDPPPSVRSGALARIALRDRRTEPGFWLPVAALAESRRGLWAAYVVVDGPEGQVVERRQLEVVHVEDGRAFVRGTLREGDRVVTGGVHRLVPGLRVVAAPAVEGGRS